LAPTILRGAFPCVRPNLMWFLGSGASAAAGIPTAFDMVWEFKQQLFISQRRVSFYSGLMETAKTVNRRARIPYR
jgi:hypothetical protein